MSPQKLVTHFLCLALCGAFTSTALAYTNDDVTQLYADATSKLVNIESELISGQYAQAKLDALQIIEQVNVIQPQTKAVKRISVHGLIQAGDLTKQYDELNFNQKDSIARVLEDEKFGQYVSLLNLLKRAQLLHAKAHYLLFKDRLLAMDLEEIKAGLLEAYNIPIYMQDDQLTEPYLLFDSDIANSQRQDMFNRELVAFLISIPELGLTEEKIDGELQTLKMVKLTKHWASLKQSQAPKVETRSCHVEVSKREDITTCQTPTVANFFMSLIGDFAQEVCHSKSDGYSIQVVGVITSEAKPTTTVLGNDYADSMSAARSRGAKMMKEIDFCNPKKAAKGK